MTVLVLITGVSPNSIGETTALAIASGNPGLLILASRTESRLQEVARKIQDRRPGVMVHAVVIDLASQDSVREAAKRIRGLTSTLHILINNAGVSLSTKQWSPDGVELTFASNHLGPFLLTSLLIPTLFEAARKSQPGTTRIVNVSSSGHFVSPFRFSDYNFEGKPLSPDEQPRRNLPKHIYEESDGFPGVIAYGSSKTANILFSVALNDRLGSKGIRSFAVDPGGKEAYIPLLAYNILIRYHISDIQTNLVREAGPGLIEVIKATPATAFKSPDQGSATSLVAALDPNLSGRKPLRGNFLEK